MKFSQIFLVFLLVVLASCNDKTEENDGWMVCAECDFDSWLGIYSGTASHFTAASNKTVENLNIDIEIEQTASDYFTVYIKLPQQNYSATLSGDFVQPHAISFASSTKSVTATMMVRENQLRLTGNSKKYQVNPDTTIIKEVVEFDVYK